MNERVDGWHVGGDIWPCTASGFMYKMLVYAHTEQEAGKVQLLLMQPNEQVNKNNKV